MTSVPHGCAAFAIVATLLASTATAAADLSHDAVSGSEVGHVRVHEDGKARETTWAELSTPRKPGLYVVRFEARGEALFVPHCNGRERVLVDDAVRDPGSKGPLIVRLGDETPHEVTIEIKVSAYEKRIACGQAPRAGALVRSIDGLSLLRFTSPHAAQPAGGEAVVFVPGGHDRTRPAMLLVGAHPWNGGPWTYAAYKELLEEAGKRDVVLLMPSGLGNSLYVAEAEDEVMRAIDALGGELAIDRQRVSIWGASMGGAGATTVAFHRPDRFAFVASFFGDSRYDLATYVKSVLGDEASARRVNCLDVLENGRHLPVFLVHGEDDRSSPMKQSTMLFDAMKRAGFNVQLERAAGMGHEAPLVVKHLRHVVERAASATAPRRPSRVSFRSVRASDSEAYGVRLVRAGEGDAFVDLERRADGVHVLAARGVVEIVLERDALGATKKEAVVIDAPDAKRVTVRWDP